MTGSAASKPATDSARGRHLTEGSKVSLTDQVYRRLKRDIVHCQLAPGSEVSEARLVERYGASKTPVREALARLQFEGLVKTMPRRGYQIAPIRLRDVNELFEMRIILESAAACLAVERATPEQLEELDVLAYTPELKGDVDLEDTINYRFHTRIAAASGNARLFGQIVQSLNDLERIYYIEYAAQYPYPREATTHAHIMAGLKARSQKEVKLAVRRHIEDAQQVLLKDLMTPGIRARFELI